MREITHTASCIVHVFNPALPHFTQTRTSQTGQVFSRSRLVVIHHAPRLLTYPTQTRFALGSRLDRQWFPWLTNHHIGADLRFAV